MLFLLLLLILPLFSLNSNYHPYKATRKILNTIKMNNNMMTMLFRLSSLLCLFGSLKSSMATYIKMTPFVLKFRIISINKKLNIYT